MASPGRGADPPLEQTLFEEPYRFDFFQAIRLLERLRPELATLGREGPPAREVVRLMSHLSLSFPASAIQQIERREQAMTPPAMTVNFLGLTGPSGVLPHVYTEVMMERVRQGDRSLVDFLDLLNHRLISLFYRAWEKHHFLVALERSGDEPLARYLFELMGMGPEPLRGRHEFPDRALLPFAGFFARRHRPAVVLEGLLRDYFDLPVEIQQFSGRWLALEPGDLSTVGAAGRNNALGVSFVVGTKVWDEQGKIRLRIGPLSFARFQALLPDGTEFRPLVQMARLFVDVELEFDVQLILRKEDVPSCRLGSAESGGAMLGRFAWLRSRPFERDADQAIFRANV
jgi:type VI secretion system protein ImpH